MLLLQILLLQIILVSGKRLFYKERQYESNERNLKSLVEEIVKEIMGRSKCIVFVTDPIYKTLINAKNIDGLSILPKYEILLRDTEQFSNPRKRIKRTLIDSKRLDCNAYVLLIENGNLTARFLQYSEKERLINTRGFFLLLYNSNLLDPNLHYLWNRIINAIFIHRYNVYKHHTNQRAIKEKIDLFTISFPAHGKTSIFTKYVDTWFQGKLLYGVHRFKKKITDLQKRHLRVAVFEHIPAVTKNSRLYYNRQTKNAISALGIEFELIETISKAMNFKPKYYMPNNIASEKWGTERNNQTHTGLISEAVQGKAAFYLGDLHYTLRHLNYFDLTTPYTTECLTFLTPESLTENSWKLLILPFKLYTWITLVLTLILGGLIFYFLSQFYKEHIISYKRQTQLAGANLNMKNEVTGLYLFTEMGNSILYTYSMLFQVSLPKLPSPWAVRVLIGWWWIYSILVSVAYRASMTATLANPVARVTIDSLTQLAKSSVQVGGWNEEGKNFFLMSSDQSSQEIGNKFQLIEEEEDAIEKVANGSFCYYENSYLLQHARVKWQVLEKEHKENQGIKDIGLKHNLHIMEECAINMPIGIGMEKNSPLKPYVDILIRRIIEIGLVQKWLNDVMESSRIMEIQQEAESEKALVNLHKLQGAFIALIVGYFLAFITLICEILYWNFFVLKSPNFDKYQLDKFYNSSTNSKRSNKKCCSLKQILKNFKE